MNKVNFVPLRDVQQERPVAHCEGCRGEIWRGETTFLWEGREICSDCFQTLVESLLSDDLAELANLMNVDTRRRA